MWAAGFEVKVYEKQTNVLKTKQIHVGGGFEAKVNKKQECAEKKNNVNIAQIANQVIWAASGMQKRQNALTRVPENIGTFATKIFSKILAHFHENIPENISTFPRK